MVPDLEQPDRYRECLALARGLGRSLLECPGGDITVSIKYMIGIHNADAGATKRSLKVMQEAVRRKLSVNKKAFNRASMGQGQPRRLRTYPRPRAGWQGDGEHDPGLGGPEPRVDCTGFVVALLQRAEPDQPRQVFGRAEPPLLAGAAKKGKPIGLPSALIWDFDEIVTGDMVVWMTDKMLETRKPGHIALVSYTNVIPDALLIAHSNGANDGSGHFGPKHGRLGWDEVKSSGNGKYIQVDGTGKVIVVRPPAWIP